MALSLQREQDEPPVALAAQQVGRLAPAAGQDARTARIVPPAARREPAQWRGAPAVALQVGPPADAAAAPATRLQAGRVAAREQAEPGERALPRSVALP